jgi:predicted negative regulator of RcsB-dependent stress response
MSDKDQIQAIKDWWKKYGMTIALSIVIVLGISFGWRYWHYYKNKQAEQASVIYEQMLSAKATQKLTDSKLFAENLIKDYSGTPYAALASFMLAKEAVNGKNLINAQQNLQWVINHSGNVSFKQIARIREARVLLAQKQLQQALQLLQHMDDKAFMPEISETFGDIYVAQGNNARALQEYKKALSGVAQNSAMWPVLEMKINQIK